MTTGPKPSTLNPQFATWHLTWTAPDGTISDIGTVDELWAKGEIEVKPSASNPGSFDVTFIGQRGRAVSGSDAPATVRPSKQQGWKKRPGRVKAHSRTVAEVRPA